jgi:hypothetical protein
MTIYFQALESVADFADLPERDSERHALLWKVTDFFLTSAEHCEEGNRDFSASSWRNCLQPGAAGA